MSGQYFSLLFFAFDSNKNEVTTVQAKDSFRVPQRPRQTTWLHTGRQGKKVYVL